MNKIEFNKDNTCLNSDTLHKFDWFIFDKYRLKTIDYFCFLINKLIFLGEEKSNIINYYVSLITKMNSNKTYMSELLLLELEILKISGYQPDLNQNVLSKIFKGIDTKNLHTNEEVMLEICKNFEAQSQFFDFLGRVITRVLINLNINLPFPRSEIIQKN